MNETEDLNSTASRLVQARLGAQALSDYPGRAPVDFAEAYRCQDRAIELWPDEIAGWKIGIVPPDRRAQLGSTHLVGPIFRRQVTQATGGQETAFPVFAGGSAAVEAEYVFKVARDIPPRIGGWSAETAQEEIEEIRIGIETAGSPLSSINARGPAVVASDFGNNAGLIVGERLAAAAVSDLEAIEVSTLVDGAVVGRGGSGSLPGGPLASLVSLLEVLAKRNRGLRAGDWISTGATTGVHDVTVGQSARALFGEHGEMRCRAEAARPLERAPETARGSQ